MLLDGTVYLESRGTVIRVPVQVVGGSVRRVRVRGLDAVRVPRRATVSLVLEDERGPFEVPAVVESSGPTSELGLLCERARLLTRLMRLMRSHFDASREIPTQPERPSALRRASGRRRE